MKYLHKGFTLIELLVVIAIIGILAAIVLVSLGTARSKGGDASVQGNLNTVRRQSEFVASANNGSYANLCGDSTVTSALNAARAADGVTIPINTASPNDGTKVTCHSLSTAWAVEAPLKTVTTSFFCVDSSGLATTSTIFRLGGGSGNSDTDCSS